MLIQCLMTVRIFFTTKMHMCLVWPRFRNVFLARNRSVVEDVKVDSTHPSAVLGNNRIYQDVIARPMSARSSKQVR